MGPTRFIVATRTPVPRANIAAVSSAVSTVFATESTPSGRIPNELTATKTMNTTTNSGTSGGRVISAGAASADAAPVSSPAPAGTRACFASRRRRMSPTAMSTGASIITRPSLTMTATASAPPPIAPPAATTCATSWIEAPAHSPPSRSDSPKTSVSSGITRIIRVPKMTTRAMAVIVSSSSASTTPSAAATAAAPQMENPHAMSSRCVQVSPISRPAHMPKTMPSATTPTITAMMPQPRSRMSPTTNCRPSRATPTRSSRLDEKVRPGSSRCGSETTLARIAPSTMAMSSGLTVGMNCPISIDRPLATATKARPGSASRPHRASRAPRGPRPGPPSSPCC